MFDLNTAFGVDETRVEEGVKMIFTDDSYLVVARMPNNRYERELSSQVERHAAVLELKTPESEKLNKDILAEVIAKTVILDWKGITDGGKVIKYSAESARKMLIKYSDLKKAVVRFAEDINNYRSAEEKAAVKK